MIDSRVIQDYTYLWYDVRPHPNFGTVEIRVCDAQTRLEHTLGLAALIQALVQGARRATTTPASSSRDYPYEMLDENKWLAARHGLDGDLVDLPEGRGADQGSWPGGCSTGCASTPRTSAPTPSSTGSRTSSSAATALPPAHRLRGEPRPARGHGGDRRKSPVEPRDYVLRLWPGILDAVAPDLFVVCKNCGSEVSPYVTECPYCGQRVRKRAPKIERGEASRAEAQAPRASAALAARLRRDEIPGIASTSAALRRRSR